MFVSQKNTKFIFVFSENIKQGNSYEDQEGPNKHQQKLKVAKDVPQRCNFLIIFVCFMFVLVLVLLFNVLNCFCEDIVNMSWCYFQLFEFVFEFVLVLLSVFLFSDYVCFYDGSKNKTYTLDI